MSHKCVSMRSRPSSDEHPYLTSLNTRTSNIHPGWQSARSLIHNSSLFEHDNTSSGDNQSIRCSSSGRRVTNFTAAPGSSRLTLENEPLPQSQKAPFGRRREDDGDIRPHRCFSGRSSTIELRAATNNSQLRPSSNNLSLFSP